MAVDGEIGLEMRVAPSDLRSGGDAPLRRRTSKHLRIFSSITFAFGVVARGIFSFLALAGRSPFFADELAGVSTENALELSARVAITGEEEISRGRSLWRAVILDQRIFRPARLRADNPVE